MSSKAMTYGMFAAAMMCGQSVWAINFGRDVTIPDDDGVAGGSSWYEKTHEDNEVEPYTEASQRYDLEGFFLQGTRLTMVGGYNFWNQSYGTRPGDLFLGLGDVRYGDGFHPLGTIHDDGWYMRNEFGYDYVLDMNFGENTYDLYAIDASTWLREIDNYGLGESNPWRYYCGGQWIGEGSMTVWDSPLADSALEGDAFGLKGGFHYAVQVDLAGLDIWNGATVTAHYTMECGNDNLMGQFATTQEIPGQPVPDGGTTALLLAMAAGATGIVNRKARR